jgi:hypothetical protein
MLKEVERVRQVRDEGPRRWFSNNYFDLVVWLDDADNITGFQLCYDKGKNERVLTWQGEGGFRHDRIDDGEVPFRIKRAPIIVKDGAFEKEKISGRFKKASSEIDQDIAHFVYDKIRKYHNV